jgi:dihydroneopterin aldolase
MDNRVLAARLVASSHRPEGQPLDRILVKDLVLDFRIGVHAHEHLAPQKVRVNLELQVRPHNGPESDDIGDVLSYEDILNGIKAIATGRHINLVETLAEQIADLCLSDPRAVRARVRIEKLEIEPAAAGVGVEIERRR